MKEENRKKYIKTENKLFSLGYNPNDLFEFRAVTDWNQIRTQVIIKSLIIKNKAEKIELKFTRSISKKDTLIAPGVWLSNKKDWLNYKEIVLPFYLSQIMQYKDKFEDLDIKPSGNNK